MNLAGDAREPDQEGTVVPLPQAPAAIELRHLRSFVAVADELNFGRAATRLYLSQPSLSRQIRALERLVGCELLSRSTRHVALTPAGETLLARTRTVLTDVADAVAATRATGGELAGRIARLMEPLDNAAWSSDVQELRDASEALFAELPTPSELDIRPVSAGGVPSLLLTPGQQVDPTVLYLHGGGYVAGSAYGYRSIAGAVAVAASAGMLVPEYRLAPEHPFPAAIEDVTTVYRWLLATGADPSALTVAGDSSGAGLVLSLLHELKSLDLPLPGAVVLLCPWLDLTGDHSTDGISDALREIIRTNLGRYLAGRSPHDPRVNPFAADLSGLPPMLVQSATGEPLVAEARAFVDAARAAGVAATLELFDVDAHVFHMFWSFLPQAADALSSAGEFIRRHAADA